MCLKYNPVLVLEVPSNQCLVEFCDNTFFSNDPKAYLFRKLGETIYTTTDTVCNSYRSCARLSRAYCHHIIVAVRDMSSCCQKRFTFSQVNAPVLYLTCGLHVFMQNNYSIYTVRGLLVQLYYRAFGYSLPFRYMSCPGLALHCVHFCAMYIYVVLIAYLEQYLYVVRCTLVIHE